MYIVDGICYVGKMEPGIKINKAKPLQGRMMLIEFSTGEKRLFDTTILKGSAFAPLEEEEVFNNPQILHGFITWKNGEIDVSPDKVYSDSLAYNDKEFLGG